MHVLPPLVQRFGEVAALLPRRVLRITFNLSESPLAITHARTTSCCLMAHLGVQAEDRDEVALLIAELASNALRHAGGNYQLELELFNDSAVVRVTDGGDGFSPDAVQKPGTYRSNDLDATGEQWDGGFGLLLVSTIAEHLDIRRNMGRGMTVRATKKLHCPI